MWFTLANKCIGEKKKIAYCAPNSFSHDLVKSPGSPIKTDSFPSTLYKDSHYNDKMVEKQSYLYKENTYSYMMVS